MNIHISDENRLVPNYELTNNKPKINENTSSSNADERPVKVTISEEGKNAYKNSVVDQEKTNYETMLENRANLMEQKPEIHYGFWIGNKLAEITETDTKYRSIEDKGAALLEAYACVYNEITQGYADGTREINVEDEDVESGYRRITMEEEIVSLDTAFEKYVSGFEARIHESFHAMKVFTEYMAELAELDVYRAEMAIKAKEIFDNMSEEDVPENISKCMLEAKQNFIHLYLSNNSSGVNLKEMLGNIKIFS